MVHMVKSWLCIADSLLTEVLDIPVLLQGIFPTQGSNPGLPHCGRPLYQLSHKAIFHYIYMCVCVTFSLSTDLLMDTGCFHMLHIVNNATMISGVHLSFRISVFIFSSYIPRSRTAGSYGTSLLLLLFFEEPPYCFS